jgi:very-short-patch-repair endonuclease
MPFRTNSGNQDRARALRRNMTEAEKKLWSRLRERQIGNLKFRRQAPLEGYIVDFLCIEKRLVIEVDGGQHAELTAEDAERTAKLEAKGYRVLRFWNPDVMRNINGVVEMIMRAVGMPMDGV